MQFRTQMPKRHNAATAGLEAAVQGLVGLSRSRLVSPACCPAASARSAKRRLQVSRHVRHQSDNEQHCV